jgi:hypothetical protein
MLKQYAAHTIASETWSQILSDLASVGNIKSNVEWQLTGMTLTNGLGGEQEVAGSKGGTNSVGGHYRGDIGRMWGKKERWEMGSVAFTFFKFIVSWPAYIITIVLYHAI